MTSCNILWKNCVESVDFSFWYNGQNLCYFYFWNLFPITFKHRFSYQCLGQQKHIQNAFTVVHITTANHYLITFWLAKRF